MNCSVNVFEYEIIVSKIRYTEKYSITFMRVKHKSKCNLECIFNKKYCLKYFFDVMLHLTKRQIVNRIPCIFGTHRTGNIEKD